MPMKRTSSASQATNLDTREKAIGWLNVTLITSHGKKIQLPVGIPLMESSDNALVQALLTKGEHGQQFQGELRLSFVGESSTHQEIEL